MHKEEMVGSASGEPETGLGAENAHSEVSLMDGAELSAESEQCAASERGEDGSAPASAEAPVAVDGQWLSGAIESMLFVTDEPVGVLTFADMLDVDPAQVQEALVSLRERLSADERGIQLREVAGGWRLYTHPRYHELIERYVLSWDTRKLSQAALETLAVVAYCQPITRNGVASVRGVSSDSSINSLVEKGLLREAGTQDSPGNPVLYATTRTFLERFGLRSVKDLPPLESFAPDEDTRAFIAERLNVVRPEDEIYFVDDGSDEDELPAAQDMQEAMQQMLSDALAKGAGAVEKINFDELVFDEDE